MVEMERFGGDSEGSFPPPQCEKRDLIEERLERNDWGARLDSH
jgi:hypothetical protein